jgi:hypothetical protein
LIKNFTFLCLVIVAGFVLTTDTALGEEPEITITIDEKITVGDTKKSEEETFEDKIYVSDESHSDAPLETESIEINDEISVKIYEEVEEESLTRREIEALKEAEEESLTRREIEALKEAEELKRTTSSSDEEKSTKESGRKIKVSSGSSPDAAEDSSSFETNTEVEGEASKNTELDELPDTNITETGQEYSADVPIAGKDEESGSQIVSEPSETAEIGFSCSSTQNQGVDASIIAMSMILVPIFFRRKRS